MDRCIDSVDPDQATPKGSCVAWGLTVILFVWNSADPDQASPKGWRLDITRTKGYLADSEEYFGHVDFSFDVEWINSFVFGGVGSFLICSGWAILLANSGDPDQALLYAASDLGLQCLPMTILRVSGLKLVKQATWNIEATWNIAKKKKTARCWLAKLVVVHQDSNWWYAVFVFESII